MTKNMATCVLLACISVLQTGCIAGNIKNEPSAPPAKATAESPALKAHPLACDELLADYNDPPALADDETDVTKSSADACIKLREAFRLSTPYSKYQSDKKALVLLKELKHNTALPVNDLHINNLLLQHVSQRQKLRTVIGAQDQRLKKSEAKNTVLQNQLKTLQSQLDQLKNIEVEIDKKERSVTSPIGE